MSKLGVNPYLPSWEYVPDGEPYVFGDRVYVYGSHDFFNGYVFCMGDYVCWSAPVSNLADWRYEGVIYPRNADPLNTDGHLRSVLLGRSESVVIADGQLDLGRFGHIYFADFDKTRARDRQVQIQIIGE